MMDNDELLVIGILILVLFLTLMFGVMIGSFLYEEFGI